MQNFVADLSSNFVADLLRAKILPPYVVTGLTKVLYNQNFIDWLTRLLFKKKRKLEDIFCIF